PDDQQRDERRGGYVADGGDDGLEERLHDAEGADRDPEWDADRRRDEEAEADSPRARPDVVRETLVGEHVVKGLGDRARARQEEGVVEVGETERRGYPGMVGAGRDAGH